MKKSQYSLLVQFREKHGLNQIQAAQMAGVTQRAWSSIEHYKFYHVRPKDIYRIAELLNVEPSEIDSCVSEQREVFFSEISLAQYNEVKDKLSMIPSEWWKPGVISIFEIRQMLRKLTNIERKTISMRFGIVDGSYYTLQEVGNKFGFTKERARQLEGRALRKLREICKKENENYEQ